MFGLGLPELIVILLILLVLFGAGRLPEIGRAIGKSIKGFKDETQKLEQDLTSSSKTPDNDASSKS